MSAQEQLGSTQEQKQVSPEELLAGDLENVLLNSVSLLQRAGVSPELISAALQILAGRMSPKPDYSKVKSLALELYGEIQNLEGGHA